MCYIACMKKMSIFVIVAFLVIVFAGVGVYFVLRKPASSQSGEQMLPPVANEPVTGGTSATAGSTKDSPFCIMDPPADQPNIGVRNWDYYKDLGIKWMELTAENERFGWQSIEKEKGKYDFSASDKDVCDFYSRGISAIYVTRPINSLYGTRWDERSPDNNEYPAGHLSEWGNFIKTLVERYDGDGRDDGRCAEKIKIKYFQIAHELSPFGDDYWMSNPDKYAEVFATAYKNVKESCADCILAMPADPLDILNKEKSFVSEVLSALRGSGIKDIAFDYHYWGSYADRLEYIERLKKIVSQYGFDQSKIKILSNESGITAIGDNGETEQASGLVKSYVAGVTHGQTKQCWTRIYDYSGGAVLWENIGLVKNPLGGGKEYKKLAYYAYKKLIEKLDGSDWNNIRIIQEKNGVYAYEFTRQGKPIWVVWNDSGTENQITISNITSSQVTITTAVPKYESGKNISDYGTAFNVETKSVSGGKLTITLSGKPVFVEEK